MRKSFSLASMFSERRASASAPFLPRFFQATVLVLAAVILASSCGGGGGGGGGVRMVEDPPDANIQAQAETIASRYRSSSEFSRQWGLGRTRADRAYAHMELALGSDFSAGKGVTIGIVDTGIDLNHPAFVTTASDPDKDRTITRTLLPGASIEDGRETSHGTAVAGVAAGGRNVGLPGSAHGVAWNANLAVFAVSLGSGDGIYRPVDLSSFSPQNQSSMNQWFSTADFGWRRHPELELQSYRHDRELQRVNPPHCSWQYDPNDGSIRGIGQDHPGLGGLQQPWRDMSARFYRCRMQVGLKWRFESRCHFPFGSCGVAGEDQRVAGSCHRRRVGGREWCDFKFFKPLRNCG